MELTQTLGQIRITEENTTHVRIFRTDKPRLEQLTQKLGCTVPETLSLIIGDINEDTILSDGLAKLCAIQRQYGFKSLSYTIQFILTQLQCEQHKIADIKTISETDKPFILTSPPRTGKTLFAKSLVMSKEYVDRPILVIDVNQNEYPELKDVGYNFYNIDFTTFRDHIRFIPNQWSPQKSVEDLFEHLDRVKHTTKSLTIIAEEAQTFADLAIFCKVLGSARHHLSGFLALTPLSKIASFSGIEVLTVNNQLPVETTTQKEK
jgi:Cdc6-like AAA superfamily ATPase